MREIETIYEELLNSFAKRAGFRPEESCDMAVRLYALAAQIQALLLQSEWVLNQSFPQTANGVFLDHHGQLRGLRRTSASKAQGKLRFSVDDAPVVELSIPQGTVCMTAENIRFQTTAEARLAVGTVTVEVTAEAVEPGQSGNVAPGSVTLFSAMPGGVLRCSNPTAFSGGEEAEGDLLFRRRILESYQRLPNGANAAFYQQVAMGHEGVAAAVAVGRARGIGTVDVCVATAAGLPSPELLAAIEAELQAKREIAVDVKLVAPSLQEVNLSVEIQVSQGLPFAPVQERAELALRSYFSGRLLGRGLRLAELNNLLYALEGVENYRILTPTTDVAAGETTLPQLGNLTLTQMGG